MSASTCRACPEHLSGCVMVECDGVARCCARRKMKHTMSMALVLCVTNVILISASAGTMQNKKG